MRDVEPVVADGLPTLAMAPCQSVEPRPDVPVTSQAGSTLRRGWASIRRSVMSHTTGMPLGVLDLREQGRVATDTRFVMVARRTPSGD